MKIAIIGGGASGLVCAITIMQKAAADLDFMAAAKYRDEMWALQQYLKVWKL